MGDDVNWFDQAAQPASSEPPPPTGEGDYGENVVTLTPKGKRKREGWKAEWHTSESGSPLPTLFNVMLALRCHPTLSNIVRYDEMARSVVVTTQIPGTPNDPSIPRSLQDEDVISIQEELQLTGLRRVAKATVQDGIQSRARELRFHPVRDYLDSLKWDGAKRIDNWLAYYLGAEPPDEMDDEAKIQRRAYISKIGRLFLIALVTRIYKPGCKSDYMLILEGPQGALKSSACRVLAGEWFSDNLPDLAGGDKVRLSMHLRGKWLIEIGELASFNAAESHTLKEFLTQTEEQYIAKYGRNEVKEPRQCLFIGSTNDKEYLKDPTGGRRFWPVRVGKIDLESLKADRDQLIAEAISAFRSGEQWWPDRDFEAMFIVPEQVARQISDPWEEKIAAWLDGGPMLDDRGIPVVGQYGNPIMLPIIERCTATQVAEGPLGIKIGLISRRETMRVSAILKRLGWEQGRTTTERFYTRIPNDVKEG